MKNIQELLVKFNIKPHSLGNYEEAFTHSSFNADANTKHREYERFEFLGDSVINMVVTEYAFKVHPEMGQGNLTKLKSTLVATNSLAALSLQYGLHEYIRVGNSFVAQISQSKHLLEDVFESFIGAVYLDQGFEFTKKLLLNIFAKEVENFKISEITDYKSKLQEETQAEHRESVVYELINESGPAHDRTFTVRVLFDGIELGVGTGSTKKQAEQNAAKQALEKRVK